MVFGLGFAFAPPIHNWYAAIGCWVFGIALAIVSYMLWRRRREDQEAPPAHIIAKRSPGWLIKDSTFRGAPMADVEDSADWTIEDSRSSLTIEDPKEGDVP